jgi:hypothetical protein
MCASQVPSSTLTYRLVQVNWGASDSGSLCLDESLESKYAKCVACDLNFGPSASSRGPSSRGHAAKPAGAAHGGRAGCAPRSPEPAQTLGGGPRARPRSHWQQFAASTRPWTPRSLSGVILGVVLPHGPRARALARKLARPGQAQAPPCLLLKSRMLLAHLATSPKRANSRAAVAGKRQAPR